MSAMNVLEIMFVLLLPLSVWRVSSILHREEGPFCIAQKIRELVGVKYDDMSEPYGNNVFSKALSCIWCISVWVAIVATTIVVILPPMIHILIIAPFGLSALAILIDNSIYKG
jgi:hypothetical protein